MSRADLTTNRAMEAILAGQRAAVTRLRKGSRGPLDFAAIRKEKPATFLPGLGGEVHFLARPFLGSVLGIKIIAGSTEEQPVDAIAVDAKENIVWGFLIPDNPAGIPVKEPMVFVVGMRIKHTPGGVPSKNSIVEVMVSRGTVPVRILTKGPARIALPKADGTGVDPAVGPLLFQKLILRCDIGVDLVSGHMPSLDTANSPAGVFYRTLKTLVGTYIS